MSSQPQLIILKASEDDNISPMASPPSRSLALSPTLTQVSFNSSPPESRQNPARASIYKKTMTKREPEPEADTHSDGDNETTAFVGSDRGGTSYNTLSAGSSTGADTQSRQSPATVRRKSQKDKVAPDGANETDGHELSWWQRFAEKYGSVELENKGSVARDHLALERTFLAWLRTSLSFASIGIAITQLFRLNTTINQGTPTKAQLRLRHVGKPLGATFLAVGIITLLIGFHRYFESQHYVIRGKFPASRGSVILMSFMCGALVVASFVVILVFGASTVSGT